MRKVARLLGTATFFAALPLLYVYLRHGERIRLVLRCGEKVLVVKGWLGNGQWVLPGGGLHKNEEPVIGALRELREETGIELHAKQLSYEGKHVGRESTGITFTYHLFVATIKEELVPQLQRHEISDAAWVPVTEVLAQNAATLTTRQILASLK